MIRSLTEKSVVVRASTGKSGNGPWGSIQLRPARDTEGLSQPTDFRTRPPALAESVVEGQVIVATLETEVVVFGRTANIQTNIVEVKAAS